MDPNENKGNEEERPFCKVCGTYDDLRVPPVCICTGSVANICSDCLLQTITHRDSDAPTDEYGEPVCPDCHTSYQNISYRWGPNPQTFNQYMVSETGWTIADPIVRTILYPILIGFLATGLFINPFPEGAWWFSLRLFLSVLYLAGIIFFGGGSMQMWRMLYQLFQEYQNRPYNVITHFVPRIGPKESTYILLPELDFNQLEYPKDRPTFPQVRPTPPPTPQPSPQIRPMPQPPFEPHIPHAGPQPQLGPILSRRGRRWSRPQQQGQPPPSARQRQSHTPRRSWTQQPRSRHQRRHQ